MRGIITWPVRKIKESGVRSIASKIIVLALIVGVSGLGYLYYQTRQEVQRLSSAAGLNDLAKQEASKVVEALGKLAVLPDEEPVVATVVDKDALVKQSAFYKNAENGDKIVVYQNAKVAYIYSPSKNKIVNVGPLIIDQPTASPSLPDGGAASPSPSASPAADTISVEVRNGSTESGRANTVADEIKNGVENVEISGVVNALKTDYKKTIVVNLEGDKSQNTSTKIATLLNGDSRSVIPEGEAQTSSDILVIVGSGE